MPQCKKVLFYVPDCRQFVQLITSDLGMLYIKEYGLLCFSSFLKNLLKEGSCLHGLDSRWVTWKILFIKKYLPCECTSWKVFMKYAQCIRKLSWLQALSAAAVIQHQIRDCAWEVFYLFKLSKHVRCNTFDCFGEIRNDHVLNCLWSVCSSQKLCTLVCIFLG